MVSESVKSSPHGYSGLENGADYTADIPDILKMEWIDVNAAASVLA